MTGSYERTAWKQELHDRLAQAGVTPARPGPAGVENAVTAGPGRNWAALWKPLHRCVRPRPERRPAPAVSPRDDRIVSLGLHHHITGGIGHDVIIDAWWASQ
jgi:hypothetical protein